jgi:predicted metal-dependent phosphotriesterase family hydrolase
MTVPSQEIAPRLVMTVQGPIKFEQLGLTDAHNHVWISAIDGVDGKLPVLDQYDLILKELVEYRQSGGASILDCQPGGCGRDGNKLLELSSASGVNIIACTGFHKKIYYPADYWLWKADAQKVSDYLYAELQQGLAETLDSLAVVKAGFIKIALEASWSECPQAAFEGAALTASKTGSVVEVHTEKGTLAEKACIYFSDRGVGPEQLVLCHMDKRPDFHLHKALAEFGALLEYDTFYRPKYNPAVNLWPLINRMVDEGFADRIALATDMAEHSLYHNIGGGPGLASLPGEIQDKLIEKNYPDIVRKQLLGDNICRRLAGVR